MTAFQQAWVYLSASPLLHLTLTLVAFQIGMFIYKKGRMNALLNPVMIAVFLTVTVLVVTDTSYQTYFDGAHFDEVAEIVKPRKRRRLSEEHRAVAIKNLRPFPKKPVAQSD